jgi:hypothetical protein
MPKIIREASKLETGDYGYSAVIMTDKADEIPDSYLLALLEWAKNVWDWESVVTLAENRAESLERVGDHPELICYNLSKDDLVGLLGGKYGGSPGPIPGFLDLEYRKEYATDAFSDDWADIQAGCYIPVGRFSEEVLAELRGEE